MNGTEDFILPFENKLNKFMNFCSGEYIFNNQAF